MSFVQNLKKKIIRPAFSNKSVGTQPKLTWCHGLLGVGCHRRVVQRSCKGHLKVTANSNQIKTVENSLFVLFLLTLCSLDMYMMACNITRSQHGPIPKHPRQVAGITFRVGGFFYPPSNHPFVNTVSYGRMDLIAH